MTLIYILFNNTNCNSLFYYLFKINDLIIILQQKNKYKVFKLNVIYLLFQTIIIVIATITKIIMQS